ncbi:unnamed protein product [Dicrocoelium dendriticum]|nr:unnamed protein product [Dicrocoelium dendriticum]
MEPNTSNKPYLNLKLLGEYVSRERTSDTISSVSILGKRVVRQYASEFILPDDTQVAVSRHECIQQPDGDEEVTLCLSVGFPKSTLHLTNTRARVEKQGNDSGAVTSISGASSKELDTGSLWDTDPEHDPAKKTDDHAKVSCRLILMKF